MNLNLKGSRGDATSAVLISGEYSVCHVSAFKGLIFLKLLHKYTSLYSNTRV